jgi:cysteine desulfuration protein SufE
MIHQAEAEIIELFSWIEEDMDRYEQIIEIGKSLPIMPEHLKTEENEVKGCQSKVWLHCTEDQGKLTFVADSNTVITKGIIALLLKVINQADKSEIASYDFGFIDKINLRAHLSSQRSNGLTAMIQKIKAIALN